MDINILMKLYNDPDYIQNITKDELNTQVINVLETSYYEIINDLIRKNPYIVLFLTKVDEEKIVLALESGLKINVEDFEKSKNLREYAYLFEKYLNEYPSLIKYFDSKNLNYANVAIAIKSGYVPTYEDIINNKALRSYRDIMEPLVSSNHELIKYVNGDCAIQTKILNEIFSDIKLTKEDLENNPELTKSIIIFEHLDSELKMYSIYYDANEKIERVIEAIDGKRDVNDLPFFNKKLGAKVSYDIAKKLCDLSLKDISEDIKKQDEYLSIMYKIIESIATLRYKSEKRNFAYKDIVALSEKIYLTLDTHDINKLKILKYKICDFIYPRINLDLMSSNQEKLFKYVSDELDRFKTIYEEKNNLSLEDTSEFCNNILNRHRNRFLSNESKKITFKISSNLELTKKKERLIINKYKLYNIREEIISNNYERLNINENALIDMIKQTRNTIFNNKKFIKSNLKIDSSLFDKLENIFIKEGQLDLLDVYKTLKIDDKKVGKYILRKYNNIRLNFLSCFEDNIISKKEINEEKKKLDVNSTNFIIGSEYRYKRNLARILLSVKEEQLLNYINNPDLMKELNYLLMYADVFKELSLETINNIIYNQKRVESVVSNYSNFNSFFRKIDDIISLSNGYAVSSDINRFILTDDVLFKLSVLYIDKYLDIYLKSLKNSESYIPNINIKINDNKYSTAHRWSPEKLLIGRVDNEASCIDLANGGEETYKEVLLEKTGSVIIIRNERHEAIGRLFLIRRGNVVQIVVNKNIKLDYEVYKNIAEQLIYKGMNSNDNIDYVVINSEVLKRDELVCISDKRFINLFPHADLDETVTLLLSKNQVLGNSENYDFKFDDACRSEYNLERKRVVFNPPAYDVNRIFALKAVEENIEESNFEPYYDKLYSTAVVGEDWFYGIKKNGEVVNIVLPSAHPEAYQEISYIINEVSKQHEENKKNL